MTRHYTVIQQYWGGYEKGFEGRRIIGNIPRGCSLHTDSPSHIDFINYFQTRHPLAHKDLVPIGESSKVKVDNKTYQRIRRGRYGIFFEEKEMLSLADKISSITRSLGSRTE